MARAARFIDRFTFGGRVAGAIGLLLLATVMISLIGAFGTRHGLMLFERASLSPESVWQGEVWRLLTWVFVEDDPLGLLFACLLLYWFGSDLVELWGSARFVRVYLGIALCAAAGTCALGLLDADVRRATYLGSWPLAAALTVAWGLYHPDRHVRIFFLLPIRGLVLAWLTVALIVACAIYFGWERYLPGLLALGLMLGWLFRSWLAARWAKARRARQARREQELRRRAAEARSAAGQATTAALQDLEAIDDEEAPPVPPEVQGVLDRILDEVSREQRAKRARSRSD